MNKNSNVPESQKLHDRCWRKRKWNYSNPLTSIWNNCVHNRSPNLFPKYKNERNFGSRLRLTLFIFTYNDQCVRLNRDVCRCDECANGRLFYMREWLLREKRFHVGGRAKTRSCRILITLNRFHAAIEKERVKKGKKNGKKEREWFLHVARRCHRDRLGRQWWY